MALFDSGNSRLHFSRWDGEKVYDPVCMPYPETIDELTEVITDFFGEKPPKKVAACSVSAQWREPLFTLLDRKAPGRLVVAQTAYDTGFSVNYDNPESIGVDRVLAACAAYRLFQDSCVVIDSGTAVTVDAVDENGTLAGGYIFPGLDVLSWSLSEKTILPHVSLTGTCEEIGNSTEKCISYGILIGFSGAVAELVKHAASSVNCTTRIVVTGGGAEKVLSYLPFPAVHKQHLVLEGLGYAIDTLPNYE